MSQSPCTSFVLALLTLGVCGTAAASAPWLVPAEPRQGGVAQAVLSEPATRLEAPIVAVTLSQQAALVRRQGQVSGGGSYRLGPLPAGLDERALSLRVQGGQVVSLVLGPPRPRDDGGRLAQLAAEIEGLDLREERIDQELSRLGVVAQGIKMRLNGLAQGSAPERKELDELMDWSLKRLEAGDNRELELKRELRDVRERRDFLQQEQGAATSSSGRELQFEVQLTSGQPALVELEYGLANCGWAPLYDLRASGMAASSGPINLELVTRAEVRQATGEDWNGVRLELTTSLPERGASRPALRRVLARLYEVSSDYGVVLQAEAPPPPGADYDSSRAPQGATLDPQRAFDVWILPNPVDVPSGPNTRTLLVAQRSLPLQLEHYALPAVDSGVWRVGRARYEGEHSLLAGPAAIFLDGDFVGRANLPPRQNGEELELPLGVDPRLRVERISLVDRTQAPGLFGSRRKQELRWRIKLVHGGQKQLTVLVQETLPMALDTRLSVELTNSTQKPASEERFTKLRAEQGLLTFPITLTPGSTQEFEWGYSLSYPDRMQLDLTE
jgi:uncharacterized protein (TIGR02231 family)